MTVGQEFHAFAAALEGEIQLLRDAEKYLYAVNMGATAIGTGINVPKGYAEKCAAHLAKLDRQADRPGRRHDRGDLGPAGLRRLLGGAQERGDQAREDLERPDPARLRAARRPGRDQPAGDPAGLVDHAGQGQPGGARGGGHRRVPGDGQRLRRDARRPQRPAPAQRLRAARRPRDRSSRSTCSTTSRCSSAPSASTASRSTRRCSSTTWRPRSASSPRSTRCSATRRRPSSPHEAHKSGKGILEVIREKKVLTEAQIKELLDPIKLTNLDPAQYQEEVTNRTDGRRRS